MAFQSSYPLAWTFHRNTMRWAHNVLSGEAALTAIAAFKEYPGKPLVALPPPARPALDLATALRERLSCRRFDGSALTPAQIGTLLYAGYGVSGRCRVGGEELLERPVPSGGGLYPLELYVLALSIEGVAAGVHHYAPIPHGLEHIREMELPEGYLADLFLGQPYVSGCAAIIIQTAVLERAMCKYEDRGYRYILLEAGHVAQNLNLVALAVGAASFNIGGFFDADLARLLGIDLTDEVPLYGTAVGRSATASRSEQREPAMRWAELSP